MSCNSKELKEFIDLNNQPNGNYFPSKKNIKKIKLYPLKMLVCKKCWLIQIDKFPSQVELFSNQNYISGYNIPVLDHFKRFSNDIINKYKLNNNSLVLDIGCNDGSLLNFFKKKNINVIGFDPSNKTNILIKNKGIKIVKKFWNKKNSHYFKNRKKPDVITSTASFYHIPDLHDYIYGLKNIMNKNSVFVFQAVYALEILKNNQFDHFYHEHSCIYSLISLKKLFDFHNMKIIFCKTDRIHGGSIIVHAALKNTKLKTYKSTIEKLITKEKNYKINQISTYLNFRESIEKNKFKLLKILDKILNENKTIYGVGAPVKASTLMNYFGINNNHIKKIIELNKLKIGKYTPVTNIEIIDERKLKKDPDYYFIFAWNFKEYFINKYKNYLKKGGKLIIPCPKPKIINK
ncbi:class I SAM-dependent methyltransferase [Pelagibacteraceae bacterium]|nr:class I SAM-dependent methyltransferase [Pelagibacteraceae bacterium]